MDRDLEKIIADSFKKLSPDLRSAIGKLPLTDITQRIAFKNNLHVDQSGALYTETLLVLLGIEKMESLASNLQRELGMQGAQLQTIVNELNENVFKAVRENLQDTPVFTPPTVPQNRAVINPARTEILSQIENPSPSRPLIPVKSEPDVEIKRGPQKPWENAKQQIAQNFIGSKLSGSMIMPVQRTQLEEKKPEIKSPGTSSDPYREPAK